MQHLQKRSVRIARHLPNLRPIHQRLIKQIRRILLLAFLTVTLSLSLFIPLPIPIPILRLHLLLLLLLRRRRAGNVESHLGQLVAGASRLAALRSPTATATTLPVRLRGGTGSRQRELDRHLVLARQVGVGDFRVRNLESGPVLDVKGELGLAEVALAPVPAAEGVFFGFEIDAVEELEGFAGAVEVLRSVVSEVSSSVTFHSPFSYPHFSFNLRDPFATPKRKKERKTNLDIKSIQLNHPGRP